jgi:hypothetical protein
MLRKLGWFHGISIAFGQMPAQISRADVKKGTRSLLAQEGTRHA